MKHPLLSILFSAGLTSRKVVKLFRPGVYFAVAGRGDNRTVKMIAVLK
jgi:hypothetical protein